MKRRELRHTTWPRPKLMWNKLHRKAAGQAAECLAVSPDFRVWLTGHSRVGAGGHAPFNSGELIRLVPKLTRSTGELGTYSDRAMRGFIETLVDGGLLAPASTARCLVFPLDLLDTNERSRVMCPEHRHKNAWRRGEWVDFDRSGNVVVAA